MVGQKGKILIAEEDSGLIAILKDFFQKEGWFVNTVQNGLEVYRKVYEFDPDIILMGINLPGRNGIATTSILRNDIAIAKDIPIILMTDFSDKKHLSMTTNSGCSDFIVKPFKFDALKSKVEKYVININKNNKNERKG